MAESPRYPGTPRWVKVFGIIAVLVILLFVHRLLGGGGGHARHASQGPGSHPATAGPPEGHTGSGGGHGWQ